ncbi:WYL domain-containing protein [Thiohalocapsa marina]|uniref:WYL domain-containing protein n=1 Tax=Thiohalocapsa marina TaxID=424902 RepID=A0A5M8FJ16_9GAMM|nr:WYL domain-containing protein [Thiohalocapsa marina]KAA6184484.1 WYL domain-containing protein [Thiohalocapsa marina]
MAEDERRYHSRMQRLKRLERLLPRPGTADAQCLDGARLLEILGDAYEAASPQARRRALQRDLETLVKEGRIQAVNPGGKPLRYRRLEEGLDDDALIWEYTLRQVKDLIAEAIPRRQLDRLWERLLHEIDTPVLTEQQLRVVSDTLRLQPVELYPDVLQAVITALAQHQALEVVYQNADGERSTPVIHPQALIQRGPIPYLFALKNDEDLVRLYALHRFAGARVREDQRVRKAEGFDLDRALAEGRVDFGQGELIDLEIRVRGYLTQLLLACPLSQGQRAEDEAEGAAFQMRIHARLPQTGQLLRWLLGAGDNLEVVRPEGLRRTVAEQARKMAAIY